MAGLELVSVPAASIVITDDARERAGALQVKTRREIGIDGGWHALIAAGGIEVLPVRDFAEALAAVG